MARSIMLEAILVGERESARLKSTVAPSRPLASGAISNRTHHGDPTTS